MKKLFILFALLSSFSFAFSQERYLQATDVGTLAYRNAEGSIILDVGSNCFRPFPGSFFSLDNDGVLRMRDVQEGQEWWKIKDNILSCFYPNERNTDISIDNPLKDNEVYYQNFGSIIYLLYIYNGSLILEKRENGLVHQLWRVNTKYPQGAFYNETSYENYQVRVTRDGQMQLVGGRYVESNIDVVPVFQAQAILWSSDFVGHEVTDYDTFAFINSSGQLSVKNRHTPTSSTPLWNNSLNYGQKLFVNDLSTQKNNGVLPRLPTIKNMSYVVSNQTKTCVAFLSGNHLVLEKLSLVADTSTPRTRVWESPDSWLPEGEIANRLLVFSWGNDGVAMKLNSLSGYSSESITFGPNAANSWHGYSDPQLVVEETPNSCKLKFQVNNLRNNTLTTLWDTESPNLAPPKPREPDQAILEIGEELNLGEREQDRDRLSSYNGVFEFVLQENGIAQLINKSRGGCVKWQPTNQAAERFVFKENGDLVLVNEAGAEIWSAGQAGKGGVKLGMQDDGNLVIYNAAGRATWATGTVDPVIEGVDTGADIYVGDVIEKGSGLISDSKMIKAIFQGDGNFVIYQTLNDCNAKSTVLFHIGLQPDAGRLTLTERGLIMYRTNSVDQEVWKLVPTGEHAGKIVTRGRLQDTGHFVLYDANDNIIATIGIAGNPVHEMPTGVTIPTDPVEPIELFNPAEGPSEVGFKEDVSVMVSSDGKCKLMQTPESGYGLYYYENKDNPVMETGNFGFSSNLSHNVAQFGSQFGFNVTNRQDPNNACLITRSDQNLDVVRNNESFRGYLKSKDQIEEELPLNADLLLAEDDNCVLYSYSQANNQLSWTDEDGLDENRDCSLVEAVLFDNPEGLPNYYVQRDINLYKGMVSTDGKCKVIFDATENGKGLALFHYTNKENSVFQTNTDGFTFPNVQGNVIQNNPSANGTYGVRIVAPAINGTIIWGGNAISTAVGMPMKLYVMSKEEVVANNFNLVAEVMPTLLDDPSSGDDDGCLLFNYASPDGQTPRVIWTEELGGEVISSATATQARVSQVLDIYPNPPQGILNLVSNESFTSYQVVDLQSRVLLSSQFTETNQTQVDVTILKQGQYRAIIYKDGRPIDSKAFNID